MNLNLEPETITWPATHYLFIERVGPFHQTAPAAWQDLHLLVPRIAESNQIAGYVSLYKMDAQLYRAGVTLSALPKDLPSGLQYEEFPGGKYARFVLTGPYSDLGAASGRVWEVVSDRQLPVRDDYAIENYPNNPRTTPENELITEILVPIE